MLVACLTALKLLQKLVNPLKLANLLYLPLPLEPSRLISGDEVARGRGFDVDDLAKRKLW